MTNGIPPLNTHKLKKRARHLCKKKSIPQKEALNIIAKEKGFESWDRLLKSSSKKVKPKKKVTLQEYFQDPSASFESAVSDMDLISGVTREEDESITFNNKISTLQYIDKPFTSYKNFKNILDKDLKGIHRLYPDTLIHVVKITVSAWSYELLDKPEKFIRQVTKRHPWLTYLLISVGPYTTDEMREHLLDGLPDDITEIFKPEQVIEEELFIFTEEQSEDESK